MKIIKQGQSVGSLVIIILLLLLFFVFVVFLGLLNSMSFFSSFFLLLLPLSGHGRTRVHDRAHPCRLAVARPWGLLWPAAGAIPRRHQQPLCGLVRLLPLGPPLPVSALYNRFIQKKRQFYFCHFSYIFFSGFRHTTKTTAPFTSPLRS